MKKQRNMFILLLFLITALVTACGTSDISVPQATATSDPKVLNIEGAADLQNVVDAGIIADAEKQFGVKINLVQKGSVDIKNHIASLSNNNTKTVDAFWAASSVWYSGSLVKNPTSIMRSYVVLAVDASTAKELGWEPAQGIALKDEITAIQAGKLNLVMCSASQCNSGAVNMFASWSALKGGGVVTHKDLANTDVLNTLKTIMGAVKRGGESTGKLTTIFVNDQLSQNPQYNAVVTYENLAIKANQELVKNGKEPLKVFYIKDAIAIADYPIGCVDNGNQEKYNTCTNLVKWLLESPDVQQRLLKQGWRTGLVGMKIENADTSIFNPDWGIDVNTEFQSVPLPKSGVISDALAIYQSFLKKPAYTAYCLDFSGSMADNGGEPLVKDAMDRLLDQNRAAVDILQASSTDVNVIYLFNTSITKMGPIQGSDPAQLKALAQEISKADANNGTSMFSCVAQAIEDISAAYNPNEYNYSVIVMTDGASNSGLSGQDFANYYTGKQIPVPTFSITFSDRVDENQLKFLADITNGLKYDGKVDLVTAFRKAKGNN